MTAVKLLLALIFLSGCAGLSKHRSDKGVTLNLSKQGLKEIPEYVFETRDLRVLKLYGNQLETLDPRICEIETLEKLYIGKNKIKFLPSEIGKLKRLKLLSAQYNDIDSLPAEIGDLTLLEQLILNQNSLTALPSSIGNLSNLKSLQLKYNWIEELPTELGNCSLLEFVYLDRNNLKAIPESFGELKRLKELSLVNAGQLVDLPESLCGLRMLEYLVIDRTTVVPTCLLVMQTNRLRIVQR